MAINKTKRPEITKSDRPKTQIIDVRDEYNEIKSFPITGELPLTIYINKKEIGIPFFNDYKQAIQDTPIDCLVISTSGPSHYEIMKYAISKNIQYIICEKPFTTSIKHA